MVTPDYCAKRVQAPGWPTRPGGEIGPLNKHGGEREGKYTSWAVSRRLPPSSGCSSYRLGPAELSRCSSFTAASPCSCFAATAGATGCSLRTGTTRRLGKRRFLACFRRRLHSMRRPIGILFQAASRAAAPYWAGASSNRSPSCSMRTPMARVHAVLGSQQGCCVVLGSCSSLAHWALPASLGCSDSSDSSLGLYSSSSLLGLQSSSSDSCCCGVQAANG